MEQRTAYKKSITEPKITRKQALIFSIIGIIIYILCLVGNITQMLGNLFLTIFFATGIIVVSYIAWKIYKSKETDWK